MAPSEGAFHSFGLLLGDSKSQQQEPRSPPARAVEKSAQADFAWWAGAVSTAGQ